jgi:hypothetical protein
MTRYITPVLNKTLDTLGPMQILEYLLTERRTFSSVSKTALSLRWRRCFLDFSGGPGTGRRRSSTAYSTSCPTVHRNREAKPSSKSEYAVLQQPVLHSARVVAAVL